MILDTLIEIDAKYKKLRLRKTTLNRRRRTVSYVFSYPSALSAVEKSDVVKAVKTLSPQGLAVETDFLIDDYDANAVRDEIIRYISESFPSLSARRELKIDCADAGERSVRAKLSADELTCKIIEQNSVVDALNKYFSQITVTEVFFDVSSFKKNIDVESLRRKVENYQTREVEIQLSKPRRFFNVTDAVQLVGKKIDSAASYISDVNSPANLCVICGKVCGKRSFPTKKQDLYVCKMELQDKTGKFPIVFFAGKDALKKYNLISDGDELIVSGRVSINNYNGQLELKAADISKCKIIDSPVREISRPEPPFYITVRPQKIVLSEQIGLLDVKKKTEGFLAGKDLVVFDFETTGLNHLQDKIIEIGAVKIRDGEIIESFQTLIDPETEIPTKATAISGITNEMVENKPVFAAVVGDFYKFTRGAVLLAHNLSFDYDFLKFYSSFSGYVFDNERYDSIILMQKLIRSGCYSGKKPANYKLATVAKALGISVIELHRALADATVTAKAVLEMFRYEPNLI